MRPSGLPAAARDRRSGRVHRRGLVRRARHSIRAAQTRKVTDMSQSLAATGLLMMLGVAPAAAAADCLSARQALLMARYEVGAAALEEAAASERYIAARAELEAVRLRREREERRARYAARDHVEAREVCRHLDDDRDAVRACEGRAAAVYDRTRAARRSRGPGGSRCFVHPHPRPVGADRLGAGAVEREGLVAGCPSPCPPGVPAMTGAAVHTQGRR